MSAIDDPNHCNEKVKTWHYLCQIHCKVLTALAAEMQTEHDIPLTWYYVLFHLNSNPRSGLRLQDLAEAIDLSQSGLTRLLDRMAEAHLVERKPCPSDRRGAYAIITETGQTKLVDATPTYLRGIDEHFRQHLNESDLAALDSVFNKILTTITKPLS